MSAKTPEEIAGKCACAHNSDGSTTAILCPTHADTDPCLTKSRVTGKRRKGTVKRGTCTNCNWTIQKAEK